MNNKRLNLYHIDMKYIRNLHKIDSHVMSVSPQIGKDTRVFLGIIVMCHGQKYCIPISSCKPKHIHIRDKIDFSKIYDDNKPVAVLNFNNMIPVEDAQLIPVDIKIRNNDPPQLKKYKRLCQKEIEWCRHHHHDIINKANVLYHKYLSGEPLICRNRCLPFLKLEEACAKYNEKQ